MTEGEPRSTIYTIELCEDITLDTTDKQVLGWIEEELSSLPSTEAADIETMTKWLVVRLKQKNMIARNDDGLEIICRYRVRANNTTKQICVFKSPFHTYGIIVVDDKV